MGNNNLAYARIYLSVDEIEDSILSRIDERYKDKPIRLEYVDFDRCDRTIDMGFTIYLGDETIAKDSPLVQGTNNWYVDRCKVAFDDICAKEMPLGNY